MTKDGTTKSLHSIEEPYNGTMKQKEATSVYLGLPMLFMRNTSTSVLSINTNWTPVTVTKIELEN